MMNPIKSAEYVIPMCFSFKFGQTLKELVEKHKTIHVLHMDFHYPEDRPVWKISTRTNEITNLVNVIKQNPLSPIELLDLAVSVQYEPLTGRKFFRGLFVFALDETKGTAADESLLRTIESITREWCFTSNTTNDCLCSHLVLNEVNDTVLLRLGIDVRCPTKLKVKLSEDFARYTNRFDKTCVMDISLHVPYTHASLLTQKDMDTFVSTLNDKLKSSGKDELAGHLHLFKQENKAGCFDVVLFLNGEKTIPGDKSFIDTMKLAEDSWHAVTKQRFVILKRGFVVSKDQEQASAIQCHRVLFSLLNGL